VVAFIRRRYGRQIRAAAALTAISIAVGIGAYVATRSDATPDV
jgi:hypothetical protein